MELAQRHRVIVHAGIADQGVGLDDVGQAVVRVCGRRNVDLLHMVTLQTSVRQLKAFTSS